MQTPPPDQVPSNYPRPNLADDRQILREVAAGQRQMILCVVAELCVGGLNGVATAAKIPILAIVDLFLGLGLLVYMIMSVVKLATALRLSVVLYVILMFLPCISLITLLVLSDKATKHLKAAGIKVGFMGVDPKSI